MTNQRKNECAKLDNIQEGILLTNQLEHKGNDLHKQYLKLAKEFHPDSNPDDPDAETKFKLLQSAYNSTKEKSKIKKYTCTPKISLQETFTGCTKYVQLSDTPSKFQIFIPAGCKSGDSVIFGNQTIKITAKIEITIPKDYEILNNKLIFHCKVPFWKLYFGGVFRFRFLDGKIIKTTLPKKAKNGDVFSIENFGLFNKVKNGRDPLFIIVNSVMC